MQNSGSDGNADNDFEDNRPIPAVYQSAIAMVEHYGWQDVHDAGPEWTALHWAASEGRADVCARLLAAAGDPNMHDHAGRSAMEYAQAAGNEIVIEMLARANAVEGQPSMNAAVLQESVARVHPTPVPSFVR